MAGTSVSVNDTLTIGTLYFRGTTNDAWGYPESIIYNGSGETITLPTHTPARTGYNFAYWNTKQDGTGVKLYPGDEYYASDIFTYLYAFWEIKTYNVYYNANGGTNAPSTQVKTHGYALKITNDKPLRTNYVFVGWGTSSGSSVVSYNPGDTYSTNSGIRLYAIWEKAYIPPRINGQYVFRCDSDGKSNDSGTYLYAHFLWNSDLEVSSIKILWKKASDVTWSSIEVDSTGTNGSVDETFGDGDIDVSYAYDVQIVVSDEQSSTAMSFKISSEFFPIDFTSDGRGVAFGKSAEKSGIFEVEHVAKFNKELLLGEEPIFVKRGVVRQSTNDSSVIASKPWFKFASMRTNKINEDVTVSFKFTYGVSSNTQHGILTARFRTDSSGNCANASVILENNLNIDPNKFAIAYGGGNYELWVSLDLAYCALVFEVLSESTRLDAYIDYWTMHNTASAGSQSSPTSTYTHVYGTSELLESVYPVNSIYMSYSHTSPAELFGGTWARIYPYYLYATGPSGVIGETIKGPTNNSTTANVIKISVWRRTA